MAQRKFLRQIAGYTSGEGGSFPRIILIDFWTDDELKEQEAARKQLQASKANEEAKKAREEAEKNECEREKCPLETDAKKADGKDDNKSSSKSHDSKEEGVSENIHPHFENLEEYDGPGSEFCVRLMCEHDQVITFCWLSLYTFTRFYMLGTLFSLLIFHLRTRMGYLGSDP